MRRTIYHTNLKSYTNHIGFYRNVCDYVSELLFVIHTQVTICHIFISILSVLNYSIFIKIMPLKLGNFVAILSIVVMVEKLT